MQTIRIFLFGLPRVESNRQLVDLKRRKTAALLAYLALSPKAVPRETLAGLFWADADQSSALAYLRHTLWEIGTALGSGTLDVTRDEVALFKDQTVWVDVLRYKALLKDWKDTQDPVLLEEAVALYQADFLERFFLKDCEVFDAWQQENAESLRRQFGEALEALSTHYLQRQQVEPALLHARRWLGLDNLNEAAHRLVIRAELQAGHRSAALRQYEACVRILSAELGVDPSPLTRQILEEIRSSPSELAESQPSKPVPFSPVPAAPFAHSSPPSLPSDPSPFIGRRMELAEIAFRLQDPQCRLLTLLGPGGIGKTRLALRAAQDMAAAYPHGIYFVPLVSVNHPDNLLPTFYTSIFPNEHIPGSSQDLQGRLITFMTARTSLVILDNMEQLTACGEWVQDFLAAAPRLNILVTTRERLNVPAEWTLEIGGMSYPFSSEGGFEEYSAVQLFLQTARRVNASLQLTTADRRAVAGICRLVEGWPLGVELAATWVRLLSPVEILREIENNLDFLTSSQRGVAERHRSLRAVYEGALELLSPDEKKAFFSLARRQDRFSRDAALEMGVNLPLLSALVDKALVRYHSDGTYDLHEVLRKYAAGE